MFGSVHAHDFFFNSLCMTFFYSFSIYLLFFSFLLFMNINGCIRCDSGYDDSSSRIVTVEIMIMIIVMLMVMIIVILLLQL